MKIRALTLENVRKFGGQCVSIDEIGDGITVVCEANEFGKSTFFDAIHAVVFEKHTATGKTIKSLQPHAGGGVRIALDVEVNGARYRIEKKFLAQKGATITDLARGTIIARDGEAEDWIAQHIGATDGGPTGLLWVRQGVLGLEPADAKPSERDRLAEARRDLLSSVAGEIEQVTGGRTMDRILRRCQDDLDALATGSRLSPKGPWKEAVDAKNALSAELEELTAQCNDLSNALTERRKAEAELQALDDPEVKARRDADLAEARQEAREAEDHGQKVLVAQNEARLAQMNLGGAEAARKTLAEAIAECEAAANAVVMKTVAHQEKNKALTNARALESAGMAAVSEAEARTRALTAERKAAEAAASAQRAKQDAERLTAELEKVRTFTKQAAEARARFAANPVTPDLLTRLEAVVSDVARLRGTLAASSVRMSVTYLGDSRLVQNGAPLPADDPVVLTDGAEIAVPGVATLHFHLPEGGSARQTQTALSKAEAQQAALLAECEVETLEDARERAQARQQAGNEARVATEMLRSLAPQGVDALEQALAAATETVKAASGTTARAVADIEPELEAAITREAELRGQLAAATAQVSDARDAATRAETELAAATERRDKAEVAAGEAATRSERLAALQMALSSAQREALDKQEALDRLKAEAPDAATAAANLKRAQDAHDNARKRRDRLVEICARLSGQITTRADEGVEERRDEVAGRLEAVAARAARYEAEVAALVRLRDTLEAARNDAREAYFEPVQEELRPLLRILHDDAGLDWETDSITPGALRRGGETEAFETLSGGTQEQIAILTRLAFARLFARRGQHLPIILDDALVYSDDDRIVKMFTALNRVALDQQIIVFSCRQLAFAGLGGDRPVIEVESAN